MNDSLLGLLYGVGNTILVFLFTLLFGEHQRWLFPLIIVIEVVLLIIFKDKIVNK